MNIREYHTCTNGKSVLTLLYIFIDWIDIRYLWICCVSMIHHKNVNHGNLTSETQGLSICLTVGISKAICSYHPKTLLRLIVVPSTGPRSKCTVQDPGPYVKGKSL